MRKSSCSSTDVSKHHRWVLLVSTVCAASIMCFTVYSSDSVLARVSKPFSGGPLAAATAFNAKSKLTAADGFSYSKAIQQVYQPRNYSVCTPANGTMACWLQLRKEVDCATLFDEYEATLKTHVPVFPPPKELPSHLRDEFLLQNFTRLRSYYFKQADYSPDATVQVWTLVTIKGFMQKAKKGRAVGHYKKGMLTIYPAIHCHPIQGLAGAIFGTEAPWLEGLLFALGAANLTTIEFRETISRIPNHKMIRPLEWVQGLRSGALPSVDFVFSFSSWEHDGLGRYGDPIDPWGDVKAMQRASCYVKPGGLLYFGAGASGTDQLEYNAHRIYGPVRLPLMTANWEVLGVYDANVKRDQCGGSTCNDVFARWRKVSLGNFGFQPVIVMRNMRTAPCSVTSAVTGE